MEEYYKLLLGILLIAFGGMLLICRNALSILLVKEQKRKIFIKRKVYNEKAEVKNAEKISIGVGIAFIIAGIYQILSGIL